MFSRGQRFFISRDGYSDETTLFSGPQFLISAPTYSSKESGAVNAAKISSITGTFVTGSFPIRYPRHTSADSPATGYGTNVRRISGIPRSFANVITKSANRRVITGAVGIPKSSNDAEWTTTAGAQLPQWPTAMIMPCPFSLISSQSSGSSSK